MVKIMRRSMARVTAEPVRGSADELAEKLEKIVETISRLEGRVEQLEILAEKSVKFMNTVTELVLRNDERLSSLA